MHFGLSTHVFHGERLTRSHFETIGGFGFREVEIFATRTHFDYRDDRHVNEVREWLSEFGIRAASMHAPICASFVGGQWGPSFSNAASEPQRRREAIVETTAAMQAARALGCTYVVVHLGLPKGQTIPAGDNNSAAVRRSLEELAEAASATPLRLALEVMPNDLSTPQALLDWLGGDLDLGHTGICLDFGHAHLLDGAPEAAETLSGHVIATHVHDNHGTSDDHRVPFDGTIDWPGTLMAMWKTGYPGALTFEVADHGDATRVLTRTVGAQRRLQAILDDLSAPMSFTEDV